MNPHLPLYSASGRGWQALFEWNPAVAILLVVALIPIAYLTTVHRLRNQDHRRQTGKHYKRKKRLKGKHDSLS